ncbi:MAG: hypothetical protein GY814_17960, partial [Gammaproteobacteria bacterium]|nr:hypothetical protein [Gammaproteobacteria bacterium]
ESEVKAIRRLIAERETGSDLLQEEDLAYYIQDAANTINLTAPGLYRRIINALKVWWAQSSVGQMFAQAGLRAELTPEMAVELAKVATKRAMIEPAMQQEEGVLASEPTDIASARKAKQLKDFKKKLGKDIDEKTAERMQEIADTSYKYKAGDVVLSASSGRRINIIGQTLIDDFREPLPPFKDYQARRKAVKARPQIPGYVIEYGAPGDVTRTTMAEWGIGGKATGPQSLKSKAQLPMDEASRMKRAEAMGFDTDTVWYHGTGKNVTEFKHGADYSLDGGWMGKGYYFGGSKSASRYATLRGSPTYKDADRAANVIPVYLKLQNPYIVTRGTIGSSALRESFINDFGKVAYQEVASRGTGTNDFINFNKHIADYLQEQGYDGIVLKFNTDTIQEVSIFDPSQARSINAAFDPKQTDSTNILHSMPSPTDFLKRWWGESTDTPLDAHNVDLAGKFRAHIIDNLATIDEKSTDVHKVAEVAKSKTSAEQSKINRMFLDPLVALAKTTGLNQKQLDEWLLARHVLLDDENWQNTQKRSWMVARDLAKALPSKLRKELDKRRISLTKDGVWIDKEGKEQKVPKASVQDRMVDLVNEYFQKAEELAADGTLGGQFTAWRDLQDSWIKIQAHSAGLYSPGKVDVNGQLLPGQPKRVNISNAPDAYDIYHGYSEDKVQHEALQAMAAKWDEMTKHQLDLLVEGGKITDEEKIAMREAHPHYVKSRRASSDNDKSFEFLNTVTASAGKPKVRAGTIEYDPVVHVMQNTIAQAHSNAQAGQQNQAALYLHREVTGNPEHWDGWFTEQKQEIHHLDTYGFLHDRPTSSPEAFDIPVTIMSDDGKSGKTVYLRPIPQNQKAKLFAAGMNKLGAQNQGAVAKVLGFGNKIVRNMAVTFSPAFLAANIFRDPATALYNLQATEGKDYTKDFLTGIETARLRSAIEGGVDKKNKGRAGLGQAWKILNSVYTHRESADPQHIAWVEEWEHAGGKQSFTQALKEMDDGWKSFESSLAIARTPGVSHAYKGLEWVEKYNIIVENISRFSAYSTVMEAWERGEISKWDTKEKAQREAAIISKELTTNFDRKGFSSQAIGLWHLFFNATVQGNVIVVRNLAKSKKLQKMVVGSVVTATMFDLLGRMSADEDDEGRNEWDNIPDYIKERNIILPFKIGGVYVKIPAPWVYNTVWRTGGMIGELAAGKRDVASVPVDMGLSLMNTFNPMASASLMQSLSPTILDPFVQAVENKNFAGNPIKPTSFPGAAALPESQLYWGSTPAAYIGLAQTLNALTGGDVAKSGFVDISPGVIHNFVNFFTAGVGKAAGQIYDLGSIPISDKEFEIKDVPILSTYATAPGKQVDVQLYHDRVAQVLRAQKAVDLYGKGKTRDIEKQRESRTKYAKELRLVNHVKDVERQLKSLRTRMRAAQGRKDTKRVKDLKSRLTSIQQKFNKTYEQRMGQTK